MMQKKVRSNTRVLWSTLSTDSRAADETSRTEDSDDIPEKQKETSPDIPLANDFGSPAPSVERRTLRREGTITL